MKTFLILDGNSLLHRAWHAIPPLTTKDGRVVNAAYGFTMVIEKMREKFQPDFMAVAWDLPGATFRHEKFEDYKGTREKKEDELYEQIDLIQEILDLYGVPSLSAEGMEADDVVGTIAKKFGKKDDQVLILTGDLDALQLVNDNVKVVVFVKGLSEVKEYDADAVHERYGLGPEQMIDLKALMGDSSDNIPGLAGVGKKTATDLLQEYGSIEGIYDAIDAEKVPEKFAKKFRGKEDEVEDWKELVTIVRDVKLPGFKKTDAKVREPDVDALTDMFRELGFRTLLKKYSDEELVEPKKVTPKKAVIKSAKLSELAKGDLVLHVEVGQQDLFGSNVKWLGLFDGKKASIIEKPTKKQIDESLKLALGAKRLIGHDLKAAFHALDVDASFSDFPTLFDTMVGAYLLSPGSRNFDLPTAVFDHLGRTLKENASAELVVSTIAELAGRLESGIKDEGMQKLSEDIEMPLIPVLYRMERIGIEVDPKRLDTLSTEFGETIEKLTKQIYQAAGREFNINSPSQLAEILFEDLGLPTKKIKKTKTGFSTAASELEKLWETHEIIPMISEYREVAKLKSTYVDTLPQLIEDDGRIHTTYNQTVAATGRLSSKDPNLQNIPIRTELGNEIRKAFVAPKGNVLVAMDYSQFELRLAAVFAKDQSFIKAFKDGEDIHRHTAAEVLGVPEDQVTKQQRYAAKAINFGILYGMGPRNLAKSTGFSREEAQAFLDTYFQLHPGIRKYIDDTKKKAHENEYVETLFGRKRYLPDINGGIQMLVAAAERMAVNMPIQGTQADLIKMAMIEIAAWIENRDDIRMLLQVHDELVFEIDKKSADKVVPKLQEMMATIYQFDVPLVVNVEVGTSWGDLTGWKK